MTSTTKINKTAPFLSIDAFGEPNAFEEHYKKWLQYEVVNGDYAKSWQQTFDVDLLSILKRRKGIQFHESPEMAKDESSEDFRARRLKDAEQVAAALFDLEKPTIRSDAKSTIIAKCAFKATRKTTLISQVLKHEMKFVNAAKQVGTISETELCEAFIACFPQEMQDELNIVGAEDKPAKKTGFLRWSEYADFVHTKAQLVHDAESALKLFYPKAKTISLIFTNKKGESLPSSPDSDKPPRVPSAPQGDAKPSSSKPPKDKATVRCFNCNKFGHYAEQCPDLEPEKKRHHDRDRHDRGRAEKKDPSAPRPDRPDSRDVLRRSDRLKKYAAAAVAKHKKKFRAKVNAVAKCVPYGQQTGMTYKDCKEMLDTDFSDPNTDSLGDSQYGTEEGSFGSDDGEYP